MCLGVKGTPHYKVASACEIPKTAWLEAVGFDSGTGRQVIPS